ncbi:MAG TPA: hypothetical protein VGI26_00685 [Solirubrobacteraceae bacterium]|jgi:hypothetical protein
MAVGAKRHRTGAIGGVVLCVVVGLVVLAQVILPGVAAKRVESRVGRYGTVESVKVSAFPAVKLLWKKADSVHVNAGALTLTAGEVGSLLWEGRGTNEMTVSARTVTLRVPVLLPSGLTVSNVRMEKHGSSIHATATLTQEQLDGALPSGFHIQPVGSTEGEVQARVSGGLFGLQATIEAVVRPAEGKLVAEPKGLSFGGIAAIVLFSDPHLKVESIGVRTIGGSTYRLTLEGILV